MKSDDLVVIKKKDLEGLPRIWLDFEHAYSKDDTDKLPTYNLTEIAKRVKKPEKCEPNCSRIMCLSCNDNKIHNDAIDALLNAITMKEMGNEKKEEKKETVS